MQPWAQLVLVVCAVAVTAAVVAAILALRQTLRRTDAVLEIVEQELRPLIGQANGLTEEIRGPHPRDAATRSSAWAR